MFNIATLLALIPFGTSIQIGMMQGVSKETLVTIHWFILCHLNCDPHIASIRFIGRGVFDPLSAILTEEQ